MPFYLSFESISVFCIWKMEKIEKNNPGLQLTRYAPTPSGFLHLGNIYSFILTYQLAKKYSAKILLRIDDLDRERVRKTYLQDIFHTLDFLELPYSFGPKNLNDFEQNYSQALRMPLYLDALEVLKNNGNLFACNCSRKKIQKISPNGFYNGSCRDRRLDFTEKNMAWRMLLSSNQELKIKDLINGDILCKVPEEIVDCVLKRKNGFPSYQLASVIDDLHFGTNLIIRGIDLWPSSLAQLYLSSLLPENTFSKAVFFHHSLMKDNEQKKLSKSEGALSIRYLRKSGKKKEDIFKAIGSWLGREAPTSNLEDFSFLQMIPLK